MIGCLIGAMGIALAGAAAAEELLRQYDPEGDCDKIARLGGTYSASTRRSCIRLEQDAYDDLKTRWNAPPRANTKALRQDGEVCLERRLFDIEALH